MKNFINFTSRHFGHNLRASSLIEALMIMLVLSITILGGVNILNQGILELKKYEMISQSNRVIISMLDILTAKNFQFIDNFTISDIPVNNQLNIFFEVFADSEDFDTSNKVYLNRITTEGSQYVCEKSKYVFSLACVLIEFISKDELNNNFVLKIYSMKHNMKIEEAQSVIYYLRI